MTEAELQAAVVEAATLFKWRYYHTRDSRKSNPGFPDLCLVRPPRLVFVELKALKGRVSPDQAEWLQDLKKSGAEVHLWRPQDWLDGEIMEVLR